MKKVWMYLPFVVLMACGGKDEKADNAPQPEAQKPLAQSQNSEAFNTSFNAMLNDYYALKDGLVQSNNSINSSVDSAGKALIASADSLKINELKADATLISTAQLFAQSVSSEAKALLGEKDLEAKRKSFQMISDNMYNLVRTVKYDREVAYYQYCPMAFNDQGAYWLSREEGIKNPYFGKKMLTCGEVKETLDFTPKQK